MKVRAPGCRCEVGQCWRPSLPLVDGVVYWCKTYLLRAIWIDYIVTQILASPQEGFGKHTACIGSYYKRAGAPVVALCVEEVRANVTFGLFEVRQDRLVVPDRISQGRPVVKVFPVASNVQHPVDRSRPTQDFPMGHGAAPIDEVFETVSLRGQFVIPRRRIREVEEPAEGGDYTLRGRGSPSFQQQDVPVFDLRQSCR